MRPPPEPATRPAVAPMPASEAQRLARLRAASILDTAPEPAFDALTRVAARVLGTPIALVTRVDGERQWFKSRVGLPELSETPRLSSFCADALLQPGPMVVPDARQDPRFRHDPLVVDQPGIRFYAAAPIVLADGTVPGTVCVIDRQPRDIDPDTLALLTDLAAAASHVIELCAAAQGADEKHITLDAERNRLTNILLVTSAGTWEWHVQTGQTRFNAQYAEMLGYRLEDLPPSTVDTWKLLMHPQDSARVLKRLAEHFTDAAPPCDVESACATAKGIGCGSTRVGVWPAGTPTASTNGCSASTWTSRRARPPSCPCISPAMRWSWPTAWPASAPGNWTR